MNINITTEEATALLIAANKTNTTMSDYGCEMLIKAIAEEEIATGIPYNISSINDIKNNYNEFDSISEAADYYNLVFKEGASDECKDMEALAFFRKVTFVLEYNGSIILKNWRL